MSKNFAIFLSLTTALLLGCSNEPEKNGSAALFNTKAEAENAAKSFGCTGAHKMGAKWMPCEKHGE